MKLVDLVPLKEMASRRAQELADSYSLDELQFHLDQIYIDMEQEAEPEGGPIADQYADEIHAYEDAIRLAKGDSGGEMTYSQAIGLSDDNTYPLEDLTFEIIKKTFFRYYKDVKFTNPQTDEPSYSDNILFPNWDDSRTEIGDMRAWENYKEEIISRFGNVTIVLKPEAKDWFDKVFIDDEKFNTTRDELTRGKMSRLQKDDERGWSTD